MAHPQDMTVRFSLLLTSTANSKDRFKLLNDDSIPLPNINNPIHPIFHESNFENVNSEMYQGLQRCLRLASLFLKYDSVLEWFVAPLLGLPLLDSLSGTAYISDPLANKSAPEKKVLVDRVRKAFDCLAHSIHFHFLTSETKFYARTVIDARLANHQVTCTQHFTCKRSIKIEIRKQFRDFLVEHLKTSSQCEQLRYDLFLAVSLVHELAHAVGVMRRNDLKENARIRLDHPSQAEFGYAWENFMFGGIINPLDKTSSNVSELFRRIWADEPAVFAAGGKDWAAVPMSYIAQWFQKGTWDLIRHRGPTAIAPPRVHLKLRKNNNVFYILSDNQDALDDVERLQLHIMRKYESSGRYPGVIVPIIQAGLILTNTQELQKYTLPEPSRISQPPKPYFVGAEGSAKPWKAIGDLMVRSYSVPPQTSPTFSPHPVRPFNFLTRQGAPSGSSGNESGETSRKRRASFSEGESSDALSVVPTIGPRKRAKFLDT